MTSSVHDPIDIEALIVARLTERLKATGLVKFVYDTKGYAEVEEESQLSPAVAVIYNGYRAGVEVPRGQAQAIDLEYLVVIVTASSTQTLRGSGAKASAGSIFLPLVGALTGWKPGPGLGRLTLSEAPGAGYSRAGFAYMPVAFTTRITITPSI